MKPSVTPHRAPRSHINAATITRGLSLSPDERNRTHAAARNTAQGKPQPYSCYT